MISDEYQLKAAARMMEAAERMERAAATAEAAAHRIALLLEDGYGGNGLKLIEMLERAETSAQNGVLDDSKNDLRKHK